MSSNNSRPSRAPGPSRVKAAPGEAALLAARAKARTPEYEQVRRAHGAGERKLGEMVRRHGGRRARYRGLARVLMQQLMIGAVVNIKRLVKLIVDPGGEDGLGKSKNPIEGVKFPRL